MSNAAKIARLAANQAHEHYTQRQRDRVTQQDRRSTYRGEYRGYNADAGLHQVELEDGNVVAVESITNGGIAEGQVVSVHQPKGSAIGFMKAMPR